MVINEYRQQVKGCSLNKLIANLQLNADLCSGGGSSSDYNNSNDTRLESQRYKHENERDHIILRIIYY